MGDALYDPTYKSEENRSGQQEASNNRARSRSRSPIDDRRGRGRSDRRDQPLLKMLVPNSSAGAIIGKGGANLKEMEKEFRNAKLRISGPNILYPSTQDRVVIVNGSIDDIIEINKNIQDKVIAESGTRPGASDRCVVKFIVPNATAGLVIGKSGKEIKAINDATGANVIIRSSMQSPVNGERVMEITGTCEQRVAACADIIRKVAGDLVNIKHNGNIDYRNNDDHRDDRRDDRPRSRERRDSRNGYDDRGMNDSGMNSALSSILGSGQNQLQALLSQSSNSLPSSAPSLKTTGTINMELPNVVITHLVNAADTTTSLNEFMSFTGAQIDVSSSRSNQPDHRVLTIFGNLEQVQSAYVLVGQRIQALVKKLTSEAQRY